MLNMKKRKRINNEDIDNNKKSRHESYQNKQNDKARYKEMINAAYLDDLFEKRKPTKNRKNHDFNVSLNEKTRKEEQCDNYMDESEPESEYALKIMKKKYKKAREKLYYDKNSEFYQYRCKGENKSNDAFKIHKDLEQWKRKPLNRFKVGKDITFQQSGIDYDTNKKGEIFLRLYGITKEGYSVICNVEGFKPYFYIQAPDSFREYHIKSFINYLNKQLKHKHSKVLNVSIVKKSKFYMYQYGKTYDFLKIETSITNAVPTLRGFFESGTIEFETFEEHQKIMTYESNFAFQSRFLVDKRSSDFTWMTIKKSNFKWSKTDAESCHFRFGVDHNDIVFHKPEGKWSQLAPFRFFVYDIECAGSNGHFPNARDDPIISICVQTYEYGKDNVKTHLFIIGSCDPIENTYIYSFKTEIEMLYNFTYFIKTYDVDYFVDFNGVKFDVPYLANRCERIGLGEYFSKIGKLSSKQCVLKASSFSSKQRGSKKEYRFSMTGRYQIDVMEHIKIAEKHRSYSLNYLGKVHLNDQKDDIHYSLIPKLFHGDSKTRAILGKYNVKDVDLTRRLNSQTQLFINAIGMCVTCLIPFKYLSERGQGIRTQSKLLQYTDEFDTVMRTLPPWLIKEIKEWVGAHVFKPIFGHHEKPVVTLDFASLYPSIMIAYNMCSSTKVIKEEAEAHGLKEDKGDGVGDFQMAPNGAYFVKKHIKEGFAPLILKDLLKARKIVKNQMRNEKNPQIKAVLNGRQLGIKMTANSVYGFFGNQNGVATDIDVSEGVTKRGQQMIKLTKDFVETTYTKKNGYEYDAKVIYGGFY